MSEPEEFIFNNEGGTKQLVFSSNRDWYISSPDSWCTISPSSGKSSDVPITAVVTCEANTSYDVRLTTLTIQIEGAEKTITIEQEPASGLIVSPLAFELTNSEQTIEITVQSNVDYAVSISPSGAGWISQIEPKGLSSGKLLFSISENADYDAREGVIKIESIEGGLYQAVSVSQEERFGLFVETNSFNVPEDNTILSIEVKANVHYEVIPEVEWIDLVETRALDTSEICLSVEDNPSIFKRVGHVLIRQIEGDLSEVLTITQQACPDLKTMSASDISLFGATLNGSLVIEDAALAVKEVWFLYSSSATTLESLKNEGVRVVSSLEDEGYFSKQLSGLEHGKAYYYVACAQVNGREYYGEVLSFSTLGFSTSVKTLPVADVGLYKACLKGAATIEGMGSTAASFGFIYSCDIKDIECLIPNGKREYVPVDIDNNISLLLSGLKCETEYYYVAFARIFDEEFYGEMLSFSTSQLPDGAVDMGLSVAWASCNIDASSPEEFGGYYAWGEIEQKDYYSWENYKWGDYTNKKLIKYNYDSIYGVVDGKYTLDLEDDVAHMKLGGTWRIPTKNEMMELLENCSWTWMNYKGVAGYTVTSSINGNSLFIPLPGRFAPSPATGTDVFGEYRTATLAIPQSAYYLDIDNTRHISNYNTLRCYGLSVRAVTD